MIQETFNYLWIREQLIQTPANLFISQIKEKDNPQEIIQALHNVLYRDSFFLLKEEYLTKIEDFLQEFRFNYISDCDINPIMNEIIFAMNYYKGLNPDDKNTTLLNWTSIERCHRNLSFTFHPLREKNLQELLSYIVMDSSNFQIVLEGIKTKCFPIDNPKQMIATFQVLRHNFPQLLIENKEILETTIGLSNEIATQVQDKSIKKLAKSYVKEVSYQVEPYY